MRFFIFLFFFLIGIKSYAISPDAPVAVDSRIKTFIYNQNDIYDLKFTIGYQAHIELSPDEDISLISIGDPFPWAINPAGNRVFIKPKAAFARTNMTIITNKRKYLFNIESDVPNVDNKTGRPSYARSDEIYVVQFFYPQSEVKASDYAVGSVRSTSRISDIVDQKKTTDTVSTINISYRMENEPNISSPKEVFDDRKSSYLRFADKPNYDLMKIYHFKNQKLHPLKFKKTGDLIIIDGVFSSLVVEYKGKRTVLYNEIL